MKGIKYRLTVYEGVLAWTHHAGYKIEEVFLPEVKIGMNEKSIFESEEKRYKDAEILGEVEVSMNDVEILQNYIKARRRAEEVAKKYLEI